SVAGVLASVATFALVGLDSSEVTVEVDVRRGLPVFTVVGLPDRAVREARDRVRSALLNSGLDFPHERLTANLAPADLRKAGPSFDLALAVGVLLATGQVPRERVRGYAVCGELSLGGALRPIHGAVAVSAGARRAGYDRLVVPVVLPPPSFDEAVEITRIQSVTGLGDGRLASRRPFRAPHHTISASGLIGGGVTPRPGEITLAHRGVLFLDELAEFGRYTLEALRQPLEGGFVEITRGQRSLRFPSQFMLVAACNGCSCGRPGGECTCNEADRIRYHRRLS